MILRNTRTTAPLKAVRLSRTGFTLLEVLVVVAIIVMLAGVGGWYVVQQFETSKVSKAKIDVRGLAQKCEQFYMTYKVYPTSIEQLAQAQGSDAPLVRPDAIMDPWGHEYAYQPPDGVSTFEVIISTTSPKGVFVSNAQPSN